MFSILSLILVTSVAVASSWLYWLRCRWWAEHLPKNVSRAGVAIPFVGSLYMVFWLTEGLFRRIIRILRFFEVDVNLRKVIFWVGELPVTVFTKAEDVEVILGSARETFKPDLAYGPVRSFFGNGLITLNGDFWLHHRKVLTPVFHFKILERYADVFKKYAGFLAEKLSGPAYSGKEIDLLPLMCLSLSQTIIETAFGITSLTTSTSEEEIKRRDKFLAATERAFKIIRERIMNSWMIVDSLFRLTPLYSEQKKAVDAMNEYALRIIRMKRQEIAMDNQTSEQLEDDTGAKRKVAFLDLVLRDSKSLLSEDEILQEVRTLVTVQQTTATTLCFIFVMLAIHQDVQERVYEEICEQDADGMKRTTYERLNDLKYLERVIKETLRLYPVTAIFGRQLKEDLALPDCTFPAGTYVALFPYVTHRDKRFFGPDPEKFDPDHFLPDRCRSRHPYAFVPFSAGPRNCIGQKYAVIQMKAVVSTLIRNFRFYPGTGCHTQEGIHLEMDTFLYIEGGFNVRLEPRA